MNARPFLLSFDFARRRLAYFAAYDSDGPDRASNLRRGLTVALVVTLASLRRATASGIVLQARGREIRPLASQVEALGGGRADAVRNRRTASSIGSAAWSAVWRDISFKIARVVRRGEQPGVSNIVAAAPARRRGEPAQDSLLVPTTLIRHDRSSFLSS